MRDDRVREREAVGSDGTKIDQGGYQAAALAFQRKLAEGARVVQGLLTQAPTCLILPTLMTTSSTGTR